MAPSLRDAGEWVEHEQRHKIRLAKIEEIIKSWDDLFFILAGEEVFKKTDGDYSSFEKSMRQSLEEANNRHLTEYLTTAPLPGDLLNKLKKLLSLDYVPPQAGGGMAVDLSHLREYYCSDFFLPSTEMILDLSLCKLIRAISKLQARARKRGITTLSPVKVRKIKAIPRQSEVFEAYYLIDKIGGRSLNWIAITIKKKLMSKGIKPPSDKTIKRYLISDAKIKNDLIAMGVIRDRTGSVQ